MHAPPLGEGPRRRRELLAALPERLAQPAFERTGGLHATGLFDAGGSCSSTPRGRRPPQRDGQGRRRRASPTASCRSPIASSASAAGSRSSWSQKAAVAGAPILVGVGAPSSLAIELARDRGLTLCGFARGGELNVYAGAERVG